MTTETQTTETQTTETEATETEATETETAPSTITIKLTEIAGSDPTGEEAAAGLAEAAANAPAPMGVTVNSGDATEATQVEIKVTYPSVDGCSEAQTFAIRTADDFSALPFRVHHATVGKAIRLADMLAAEYPALSLEGETDGLIVTEYRVIAGGETIVSEAGVPDISDILDACEENGIDPEEAPEAEADDEGERVPSSVVPAEYAQRYREASSTGTTCGDWLAEILVELTTVGKRLNVEILTAIFAANGLDMTAKWARLPLTGARGWQGRYRMNGRQVLERIVSERGYLVGPDGVRHEVPADAMAVLRVRHEKWLAKRAKASAAAAESIREAVEGEGGGEGDSYDPAMTGALSSEMV